MDESEQEIDIDEEEDDEYEEDDVYAEDTNVQTVYIVPENEKRTSERLTVYEATQAIGTRISQIEGGSPVFITFDPHTPVKDIAINEFIQRKTPLILRRTVEIKNGTKKVEMWKVREMIYPVIPRDKLGVRQSAEPPQ